MRESFKQLRAALPQNRELRQICDSGQQANCHNRQALLQHPSGSLILLLGEEIVHGCFALAGARGYRHVSA